MSYPVLQCAVGLSSRIRPEAGHTSLTSQEQWAVFSWITVASSPLLSHWFAVPNHSPRQEAGTNRNDTFSQSGTPLLRWLIFKVTFFDEIRVPAFCQEKKLRMSRTIKGCSHACMIFEGITLTYFTLNLTLSSRHTFTLKSNVLHSVEQLLLPWKRPITVIYPRKKV